MKRGNCGGFVTFGNTKQLILKLKSVFTLENVFRETTLFDCVVMLFIHGIEHFEYFIFV